MVVSNVYLDHTEVVTIIMYSRVGCSKADRSIDKTGCTSCTIAFYKDLIVLYAWCIFQLKFFEPYIKDDCKTSFSKLKK